jgi:hypothetical protein
MPPHGKFIRKLLQDAGPIVCAEVGVFEGDLTEYLLSTCSNIRMIYCVDTWIEYPEYISSSPKYHNRSSDFYRRNIKENNINWDRVYTNFVNRTKRFRDRVIILRKDSLEASECFEDDFFDFVFIDANHGYEYIAGDIFGWTRKVKNGGIVAGHDYVDKPGYGVIEAVNQFFGDDFELHKKGRVWYHEKKVNDQYNMYRDWVPPARNLGSDWYKAQDECDNIFEEDK